MKKIAATKNKKVPMSGVGRRRDIEGETFNRVQSGGGEHGMDSGDRLAVKEEAAQNVFDHDPEN